MRRHIVKTLPRTWHRRGFLPEESYYLSEIGRYSAKNAPYIQAMIRQRLSMNANRVKYHWSYYEYRRRVVAEYVKMGVRLPRRKESIRQYLKNTFYDFLNAWKKRILPDFPEWETPRAKRVRRKRGEPKAQATKRQQLNKRYDDTKQKIVRAIQRGDQRERRRLEKELDKIYNQLQNLR